MQRFDQVSPNIPIFPCQLERILLIFSYIPKNIAPPSEIHVTRGNNPANRLKYKGTTTIVDKMYKINRKLFLLK